MFLSIRWSTFILFLLLYDAINGCGEIWILIISFILKNLIIYAQRNDKGIYSIDI